MLEAITPDLHQRITNPVLKAYAQIYLDIETDFRSQIATHGLSIETKTFMEPGDPWVKELVSQGLIIENDHKSLCTGWISPSCIICRKGLGTVTYSISTQCPRHCFFCFNPNQEDYLQLRHELNDPVAKLRQVHEKGIQVHDVALTGGEPLLHKPETERFFVNVQSLYPDAYTRLYTSGAFLDEEYLHILANAGLDEIRFSIKTEDPIDVLEETFKRIEMARKILPAVVVEMPVMPDGEEQMQELLVRLDELGVDGINLLELCFPYHNAEEFARRGYKIKARQFRVLYDYTYAGGLPIAGSEEVCLRLLAFAMKRGLSLGVHYCSLENKFSGQVYLQNFQHRDAYNYCTMSNRDYFLKSAKVFGRDASLVRKEFLRQSLKRFRYDSDGPVLEFPPTYLKRLQKALPQLEAAICYHVFESSDGGLALRELRIDLTTPETFDPAEDL